MCYYYLGDYSGHEETFWGIFFYLWQNQQVVIVEYVKYIQKPIEENNATIQREPMVCTHFVTFPSALFLFTCSFNIFLKPQ